MYRLGGGNGSAVELISVRRESYVGNCPAGSGAVCWLSLGD